MNRNRKDDDEHQLSLLSAVNPRPAGPRPRPTPKEAQNLAWRFVMEGCSRAPGVQKAEAEIKQGLTAWLTQQGLDQVFVELVWEALLNMGYTRDLGFDGQYQWHGLFPDPRLSERTSH